MCGVQQVVFRLFWTNFGFTKGADENLNQKNLKKKLQKKKMRIGSDNQKKHGDMVGQSISMGGL